MFTHVRSPEHSQTSAIGVLGSPDHRCGTVCPLNCDNKTSASPSLGGYLRIFVRGDSAHCDFCFNGAGYKHSYLLTYLLKATLYFEIAPFMSSTRLDVGAKVSTHVFSVHCIFYHSTAADECRHAECRWYTTCQSSHPTTNDADASLLSVPNVPFARFSANCVRRRATDMPDVIARWTKSIRGRRSTSATDTDEAITEY